MPAERLAFAVQPEELFREIFTMPFYHSAQDISVPVLLQKKDRCCKQFELVTTQTMPFLCRSI